MNPVAEEDRRISKSTVLQSNEGRGQEDVALDWFDFLPFGVAESLKNPTRGTDIKGAELGGR